MNEQQKKYDAIVIGAGIGGLFAAAKLSKEGKKVLVLEKHTIPGGYATTFKRGKFTFEAGLHAIDGFFDTNNPNNKIFEEFGILEALNFIRLPEFYRLQRGDFSLTIPDDTHKARELLEKVFPQSSAIIRKFFRLLVSMRKEIIHVPTTKSKMLRALPVLPFKYPNIIRHVRSTLGTYMDRLTNNEELKIALTANAGYYHDNPYNYSLLHYFGAQGSYFEGGCAYIKGGSSKLAEFLEQYITSHGGEVRYKHCVDQIIIQNKRVKGIISHNGKSNEKLTDYADFVIANAPIPTVIHEMLPQEASVKLRKKFGPYENSHSVFSLYLGLKNSLQSLGHTCYSTFILPDTLQSFKDMSHYNTTDDFEQKIIALIDYSQIDSGLNSDELPTASCVVIDNIKKWEGLSPDEYREKKEKTCAILMARLEKYIPGISDSVVRYEAATPRTMKRYTSNPDGSIYGFAQGPSQVGLQRPDVYSGIQGLYFASAWSKPGGGITPAAKCGYNAACEILNK